MHGFRSSATDVRSFFREVESRPRVVLVELCEARWKTIMTEAQQRGKLKKERVSVKKWMERMEVSFGGRGPAVLAAGLQSVSSIQKLSGFDPGVEFRIAAEEGERVGAKFVLGDQSVILSLPRNDSSKRGTERCMCAEKRQCSNISIVFQAFVTMQRFYKALDPRAVLRSTLNPLPFFKYLIQPANGINLIVAMLEPRR